MSEVTEDDGHNKHYYLGPVNSTSDDDDDEWTVTLDIENKPVKFQIDSGADCSVMSETAYETLELKRVLHKAKKVLSGPGGGLNCLRQFITQIVYKGKTYTFRLYVIRGESVNNLLSQPTSLAMGLIKQVYEISTSEQEFGLL